MSARRNSSRQSLLGAAGDALGFRFGRRRTSMRQVQSEPIIEVLSHVIDISPAPARDEELEERQRLRDAAAQSIGLLDVTEEEQQQEDGDQEEDQEEETPAPNKPPATTRRRPPSLPPPPPPLPPFPTSLTVLAPLAPLSAALPKYYPPSSLRIFALSKQWKPRRLLLSAPSPAAVAHLHLFKPAGADPRQLEVERLEINAESVVFVADADVAGRTKVVKVGGTDVGALKRDWNLTDDAGRTMWFLQLTDSVEAQRWISAIKSAIFDQRTVRAGLGSALATPGHGSAEPRGDMDVMLSIRAQQNLAPAPPPPVLAPVPPSPTTPSPGPSPSSYTPPPTAHAPHPHQPHSPTARSYASSIRTSESRSVRSVSTAPVHPGTTGSGRHHANGSTAVAALKGLFSSAASSANRPRSGSASSWRSDDAVSVSSFGGLVGPHPLHTHPHVHTHAHAHAQFVRSTSHDGNGSVHSVNGGNVKTINGVTVKSVNGNGNGNGVNGNSAVSFARMGTLLHGAHAAGSNNSATKAPVLPVGVSNGGAVLERRIVGERERERSASVGGYAHGYAQYGGGGVHRASSVSGSNGSASSGGGGYTSAVKRAARALSFGTAAPATATATALASLSSVVHQQHQQQQHQHQENESTGGGGDGGRYSLQPPPRQKRWTGGGGVNGSGVNGNGSANGNGHAEGSGSGSRSASGSISGNGGGSANGHGGNEHIYMHANGSAGTAGSFGVQYGPGSIYERTGTGVGSEVYYGAEQRRSTSGSIYDSRGSDRTSIQDRASVNERASVHDRGSTLSAHDRADRASMHDRVSVRSVTDRGSLLSAHDRTSGDVLPPASPTSTFASGRSRSSSSAAPPNAGKRWSRQSATLPRRLTPPTGPPPPAPSPPSRVPHPYAAADRDPPRSRASSTRSAASIVSGLSALPGFSKRASVSSAASLPAPPSFSVSPPPARTRDRASVPPPPRPAPTAALPAAPWPDFSDAVEFAPTYEYASTPSPPPSKSSFRESLSAHRPLRLSLMAPKPPPDVVLPPRPDEPAFRGHARSGSTGTAAVRHQSLGSASGGLYSIPASPPPNFPPPRGPLPPTPGQPTRHTSLKQRLRILSNPTPPHAHGGSAPASLRSASARPLPLTLSSFLSTSTPTTPTQPHTPLGEKIIEFRTQNDPSFLLLNGPSAASTPLRASQPLPTLEEPEYVEIPSLLPPPRRSSRQLSVKDFVPPEPDSEPEPTEPPPPRDVEQEAEGAGPGKLFSLSRPGSVISLTV
ncbi:hypothetical protein C8J57DRAFT_1642369 [Mycena rebaudengoi]|nr:hypothetical protein C8J57DRAFT_1642369 [Mycena rebaudengoi]